VTIAPVGRLWRRARREHKLPDPEKIAQARSLVGSDKLVLDPTHHTVQLQRPGMKLDVGGIAKGYAAQAAVDALRGLGISRALVGGAGDIVVGDPPPGAQGWTIGVATLNPTESEPETYLLLKSAAISTAGDAERFVIIGGRRYSHIINPITAAAVEDRASVTVVAPDGATADALETSVYLLGPERGLKLIEETPGAAALYVRATPSGIQTFESSRFKTIPRTKPKPAAKTLPDTPPVSLGFDPGRLKKIDAAIDRAISEGKIPGAVVIVGRRGKIAYARAAGRRAVEPAAEAMTRDTVFDMASLTKPVVTATAALLLIEEGKFRLSDRVVKFLPELDNHGKSAITIEHLLRHRAGLVPDNPLKDFDHGPTAAWKQISELEPASPPGAKFVYSDVGFMILGKLIERVAGQSLDEFARQRIFQTVGMTDASFRPLKTSQDKSLPAIDRIAPTEREPARGPILRGVVHDPRSRALGGVAGHAGLFATADDLAVFAQTLLAGGRAPTGTRLLSPLSVRAMFDAGSTPPGQRRGLGWDVETSYSSPRGALFGPGSLGHTGFTGTSLWIDPETETFVILLTSRLHPTGDRPAPTALRFELATLAAAAIVDVSARHGAAAAPSSMPERPARSRVLCGIDVLAEHGFKSLLGQRVGLVTNHTCQTRDGRSTIDVLFKASGVNLVKLFSPEHGIRGEVDTAVPDGVDQATGLPIVSLYGSKKKPSPKDLEGLDTLVFDIQDIGVRYYTYSTTLGLVLEAVKESDKKLVVLDRPNPIGGTEVTGPVRDPDLGSFIAYHALPVRHGMTLGELALLYNHERGLKARLEVIACQGWTREQTFDQTDLVWINPSPNMRSLTEAILYPGVGWLESTNLATGRGTDTPFERVGAPWIDPRAFADGLGSCDVPGARFTPIWFVPKERQYAGERCGGVQIVITDWIKFEPLKLGVSLAVTLRKLYPDKWNPEPILRMLCHRPAYEAIRSGKGAEVIENSWWVGLEEFRRLRARYLLYR
jgi:uncharacterized protein YbbC (DUF1343 family)/CubicO group peptidase (beta-lactamase class C family)